MTDTRSQPSTAQPDEQRHETIFLQPWCNGCDKHSWGSDGRQWCEDDAWSQCEECEQKSVKYVRADSHAALTARIEEMETALRFIADGYENHDVNHLDYRVKVYQVALDVLQPKGAAMSEPFVKDQAHRERIEKGEAILPSYPVTTSAKPLVADVQEIHRQAASMFLCWPTNAIDLAKKDSDLPALIAKLAQFIANWEAKGADMAQAALSGGVAQQAAKPERRAPVQGYSGGIPWSMHLRAYDAYCKKYSPQQALIEGGCRGGFGVGELDDFIPGWREELSEIAALKSEIARLSAALSSTLRQCPICARRVASPCETLAIATSCPLSSTHREAGK